MDLKKIGIIGVDGIGERFATGQVLKTREFRKWFSNRYGEGQVLFANIDSAKKHPLRVLHNISKALKECENILFMPGQNVGVFAPLTAISNKHYKRRIQFIVTADSQFLWNISGVDQAQRRPVRFGNQERRLPSKLQGLCARGGVRPLER